MDVPGNRDTSPLEHETQSRFEFFCQPCEIEGDHLEAEGYCETCKEYLCHTCYKHHRRPTPMKHHFLRDKEHMPRDSVPCKQPEGQANAAPDQDVLTASMLAAVPTEVQTQMLGERLYPLILGTVVDVGLAGKITGMCLEMDNSELLDILASPDLLKATVAEAKAVLQAYQA